MELTLPASTFDSAALGGDRIRLLAGGTLVAELDGRYWTAETCASFTGRVIGLYASQGTVRFGGWRYRGSDAGARDHGDTPGYQGQEAGPGPMTASG